MDENGGPFVPETVTKSWRNFADPKDLVSVDLTLEDEYKPSKRVNVVDVAVSNGYNYPTGGQDKHNHHKSYGYLRTVAFAQHLKSFLTAP